MEHVNIDYMKIAVMNRIKEKHNFSNGYTFRTGKENSLEYVINLTENMSTKGFNWLVSIPQYNTCFLLPASTITARNIEEQLQNVSNEDQNWNRDLAECIYKTIEQILKDA
ncbi:hypothetical protein [Bacillus sp. RO1]|uniref:hypothetical protein n=1 Tax=Bacillus sp. RO1 TaxID=2722703 RepID=UPI001457700E|nr:hypothetical protein [Bacillus sp. RO1]NLP52157.1 hypothetical protein [Bacillus sp. RO1]